VSDGESIAGREPLHEGECLSCNKLADENAALRATITQQAQEIERLKQKPT